jgi:hypothetical protein
VKRRGWKAQRAALFSESGGAFGGPEAPAAPVARAAAESDPLSDIWGEAPPRVAGPEPIPAPEDDVWGEPEVAPQSDIWTAREDAAPDDVWREPAAAPASRFRRKAARAEVVTEAAEPAAPRPKRVRKPLLAPREEPLPKDLVGRDLAGAPRRVRARRRLPLPLLAGAIVAALLLVTLRVEILRLRYAAAAVAEEEETLLERIAQATVRVRELRDPARLRRLAAERGFGRPERVISVELPARLPAVAAAPAREAKP